EIKKIIILTAYIKILYMYLDTLFFRMKFETIELDLSKSGSTAKVAETKISTKDIGILNIKDVWIAVKIPIAQ
ncbi:hypothetical protein, partial [Clostridioides difficile]